MAAVHSSNSDSNSNGNRQNGTASPGGWHFPKSGLGTPDLFYSFSGGSSGNGGAGAAGGHAGSPSMASQQQPAWFKPQGNTAHSSTGASASRTSTNGKTAAGFAAAPAAASTSSATRAIKKEEADGDNDDAGGAAQVAGDPADLAAGSKYARDHEEANRTHRALSDPPVRQSPAWIFPSAAAGGGFGPHKTHLEQEPNPFEHSFSVKDSDNTSGGHIQFAHAINAGGNAGTGHYHAGYPSNAYANANNSYQIGPSRRARSQSPKSAGWQHSGINAGNHLSNPYQDQNSYSSANLFSNTSATKGAFANLTTPSSELPSFGWAFDQSSSASNANGRGVAGSTSLFDPTSIRTGLTPGGPLDGNKHSHHLATAHSMQPPTMASGAPHSPATQALFAMMTNATPGAEVGPYNSIIGSQQQHKNQQAGSLRQDHQAALGDTSRSSSNNSNSSTSQQATSTNKEAQAIYSQAVPRPMQPTGAYNDNQQYIQAQYHAGNNPAYLQQNMPRPIPPRAFDSTQSSDASSSQSVPQLQAQQQKHQQQPGGGTWVGGTDQNPLHLLSQQAQDGQPQPHPPQAIPPHVVQRLQHPQGGHQRHPSDTQIGMTSSSHNEDAMLAAAALSGLSTPRPAYIGGQAPGANVNPGTINTTQPVPNLVQPPPGRQQQQQQGGKPQPPPANLFHTQKSANALTKENMKANNKANAKKGGATSATGTNKRKKGATATPEPVGAGAEDGKKVRRTSRRTAASSSNLAEPLSEDEQMDRSRSQLQPNQYNDDPNNSHSFNRSVGVGGGENSDDNDDDMLSNNGSFNESRDGMGGSQAGDGTGVSPPRKGGRGPKQHFATEEDKRKNFLERNRQAALKCRQRKKQWLTQLQSKVEYLTADNETLQTTVTRLREEVANLRAILGAHGDCQMAVPPGPTGPGGITSVGAYMHNMQQQDMPPQHQQHPQRQY